MFSKSQFKRYPFSLNVLSCFFFRSAASFVGHLGLVGLVKQKNVIPFGGTWRTSIVFIFTLLTLNTYQNLKVPHAKGLTFSELLYIKKPHQIERGL